MMSYLLLLLEHQHLVQLDADIALSCQQPGGRNGASGRQLPNKLQQIRMLVKHEHTMLSCASTRHRLVAG